VQAIIGRRSITFDKLYEIESVKQHQSGDTQMLIIASRNSHDRQKIIMVQSGPSRTYINERDNRSVGHI